MSYKAVCFVATILIVVVFFIAGLSKLAYAEEFAETLRGWALVPEAIVPIVVFLVPLFEIVLSVWIILNRTDVLPRLLVVLMLFVFTIIVVVEHLISGEVSCGCFGERVQADAGSDIYIVIVRNAVLIAAAVAHPKLMWFMKGNQDA